MAPLIQTARRQPYWQTSTESADPVLTLFRARKDHAMGEYQPHFAKCARRYDLYRGHYRGNTGQYRNMVHIPFLFSIIQSDVARKVQISFGSSPLVEFIAGPGHSAEARRISALVGQQLRDCDSFVKAVDFYLSADMYGTAIAMDGWKTVRRKESWRSPLLMPDGSTAEQVKTGMVTRFDGPNWENIDILDFLPQPGRKRIKDCQWAMRRYYLDQDEVRGQEAVGTYDAGSADALGNYGMPSDVDASYHQRLSLYRSSYDYEQRVSDSFARPVECWDMIGWVPREFAPDGVQFRIITVGNNRVIMRNRPYDIWHGELPFHVYTPMSDPHHIHGVGKIEIGEKMQYLANKIASQKADAFDNVLDPPIMYDRTRGIDSENLYLRSGRTIGVDGAVTDDAIRPFVTDLRGLQASYAEIEQLWRYQQQGTGIVEDTIMGLPSSGRQTKAEFQGRQENVLSRQMLEASLAEHAFFQPVCDHFHALNRQFLRLPQSVNMLGIDAQTDPLTGMPLPPEPAMVDLSDFWPDYRARAVGATQMLHKSVRQQNLLLLTQTIQTNPVAVQVVNWVNWIRYTLRTFDLPHTEDFLNIARVPAVNQAAAQAGISPEQAIQTAGGALTPGGVDQTTLMSFLQPAMEAGAAQP